MYPTTKEQRIAGMAAFRAKMLKAYEAEIARKPKGKTADLQRELIAVIKAKA